MSSVSSFFLIGKTGHGKSSTGNSLLGRHAFTVSDSSDSVTSAIQIGSATRNGRQITVIDGPGLGDTRLDNVDALRKTYNDMQTGIGGSSNGIGAFLLVLKYGNRFTEEEKSTVDSLKSIMGDDFVKNHCIIVFTHGEIFDINNRTSGLTFADWLSRQEGSLKCLIDEVENRCVLAHNAEEEKMVQTIEELCNYMNQLVSRKGPYTLQNFNAMEINRQQLLVRMDAGRLQQTFDSEVASLSQVLSQIQNGGQGFDDKLARLATLANDVRGLKQRITDAEIGTGVLSVQQQACDSLLSSVQTQEASVNQAKANEAERVRLETLRAEQQRAEEQARQIQSQQGGSDCQILESPGTAGFIFYLLRQRKTSIILMIKIMIIKSTSTT